MTRKAIRAKTRMNNAKYKKQRRFMGFLYKLARRKLKDQKDGDLIVTGLCCRLQALEVPRDEFLAKGQQLAGGAAVLFSRNEISKVLPYCKRNCGTAPPILIMTSEFGKAYNENGIHT